MNRCLRRIVCGVLRVVLVALVLGGVSGRLAAQPANLTLNTVGERSALMAGAVVAAGGTADSVYYNPAGLAQGRHSMLSVSNSAFTYVTDGFLVGVSTSFKHVRVGTALQVTLIDRDMGEDTTRLMLAGSVDARMLGQEFTAGFSWRPARWLRGGGRVENNLHWTADKKLHEGKRPWIRDPHGMLVMNALRRIAYNILSRQRARTLCSDDSMIPWKELVGPFYDALRLARHEDIMSRRQRCWLMREAA